MNAREIVFELLTALSRSRRTAEELLEERAPEDRALVQELFYGCLRQRLALDFLLSQLAGKPPRRSVAAMLHLGLYQLAFMRIPSHAAVHQTVALAKRHASAAEAGFVNAMLRKAAAADLAGILSRAEPWVRLSHPRWLWERHGEEWCQWNNRPPSIYIRLNTLKASSLPAELPAEPTAHPLCWRLINPAGLFETKAWATGAVYVQDPSTLLAVDVLDPQPGESVLDLCAAPGGKTTYIAQKMRNTGRIVATDSSQSRLKQVVENCRRLGVSIVATGTSAGGLFDRVLVDAPCSNTGVMRRRVDLRWRIRQEEIERLAALQDRLLAQAGKLTKPGGVLVYSTCSLEPEENERVVERFRESHPEFALETTRSLFPPRDGVDGAFAARFRKD